MSFADHIRACNNFDRARVVPLIAGGRRIGWLRRDNAVALARFDTVFAVEPERVALVASGDVDRVSAAVDEVVEALVAERNIPKWRNETFDVMARWGDKPIFRLDRGAVPFGAVTYCMETELGIRDDVLFVYDIKLPDAFEPKNSDGEIVRFDLMPAEAVVDRVRKTDDFKFNVNLVILDFALRHGLISVEDPEYLDVASGLHRPLD